MMCSCKDCAPARPCSRHEGPARPRQHRAPQLRGPRPCCVHAPNTAEERAKEAGEPQTPVALHNGYTKRQVTALVETRGQRRRVFTLDGSGYSATEEDAAPNQQRYSQSLLTFGRGFLLPRGFPDSVTDDYIAYQLWALPSHVFGWMSHSLATSSLLTAVGVHPGAAAAVGATAAVKWITKDGIGAFGRLLVGGRLGNVFDEDPKRWRMLAETLATLGLSLEISTAFFPGQFIALAGAGNLALAAGKGMGKPCFRIIQTHFARKRGNVGDVAAKEEVWEVIAQMLGLGGSILALGAIEDSGSPTNVLWAWATFQALHVGLRYQALSLLQLPNVNQKRGAALVRAHVAGHPIPGVKEANSGEAIFMPPESVRPRVKLGCSLEEAFPADQLAAGPVLDVASVYHMYGGEQYVLTWLDGRGLVLLRETAVGATLLRAMWQAAWLDENGISTATASQLEASLHAMQRSFPSFLDEASAAGWLMGDIVIRSENVRFTLCEHEEER